MYFSRISSVVTFLTGRGLFIGCLIVLFTACASTSPVQETDAKLMARNFLNGQDVVRRAPGVDGPNIPYRYMTDFRAETVSGSSLSGPFAGGQTYWSVRVQVTEGKYKGTHHVFIDPEKKEVVNWR